MTNPLEDDKPEGGGGDSAHRNAESSPRQKSSEYFVDVKDRGSVKDISSSEDSSSTAGPSSPTTEECTSSIPVPASQSSSLVVEPSSAVPIAQKTEQKSCDIKSKDVCEEVRVPHPSEVPVDRINTSTVASNDAAVKDETTAPLNSEGSSIEEGNNIPDGDPNKSNSSGDVNSKQDSSRLENANQLSRNRESIENEPSDSQNGNQKEETETSVSSIVSPDTCDAQKTLPPTENGTSSNNKRDSVNTTSESSSDDCSIKQSIAASTTMQQRRSESSNGSEGNDRDATYPWNEVRDTVSNLRSTANASVPEKPKRIFQHPPEEYLPMVLEDMEEEEDDDPLSKLPTPPDGGWGWVVVFGSFMIHVFADGFTYTLGIFYVHLLEYYDVSKAAASLIMSILVGVTLGSGPISGALVNKFGCRAVVIGGALLASFMVFVSVYAQTITTLYVTIGLGAGLGFGLIYLPAIVCVTGYFEKKRSFATGLAVCGSGFGTFLFAPLVEYLIAEYNWKGALIIISGLILNCIFFGALFRPLEAPAPPRRRRVQPQYVSQYSTEPGSPDALMLSRPPLPSIQISGDPDLRKNFSEACLPVRTSRRRPTRHQSVSSANPGAEHEDLLDIQRINSHGSLNPILASLRRGEAGLRMTVSQPLFPKMDSRDRSASPNKLNSSQSGLLHRKDIFYNGSLMNIPEYKQNPTHYRETIMRSTVEEVDTRQSSKRRKILGCLPLPCSPDTIDTIHAFMDLDLLKDPIFQLFSLSNFFTSIGFYAPYIFIVDRARDVGISSPDAAKLLAVVGISNTVSRVVLGYISDRPCINRLYLYNMALTICGIATWASIWMNDFKSLAFYAAVFGSTSGAYVGLTSVVLVDLLGMERLTNAFGLLLLFQGIASVLGPPLCGSLYEVSGNNYNYTFMLAGGMIAISGLMLFSVPCIQRYYQRKAAQHDAVGDHAASDDENIV